MHTITIDARPAIQPFRSAEEAWFWTVARLAERRDNRRTHAAIRRPCEPDDVVACLDTLYRRRHIDLVHARVLRMWGERQVAPDPSAARERADWRLWTEAMDRLSHALRIKGIVD